MESKEYKELKKEISSLQKDIGGLQKNSEKMCNQIDKIHTALVGDAKFGHDGLVKMVRRHEEWLMRQKYMYAKIYGGMIAISTITTLMIKFWDKIF